MFCKVVETDDAVEVSPTRLGVFLNKWTCGLITPYKQFDRDFGPGSFDRRLLRVTGSCHVRVVGDSTTVFRVQKSGMWSDPEVWRETKTKGEDHGTDSR